MADWGVRRGGAVGGFSTNAAAFANAAAEATGLNDLGRAVAAGDAAGGAIALAGLLPVGKVARIGTLVDGSRLPVNAVLDEAIEFLGTGYREAAKGRFVSKDGLRQFRIQDSDILSARPHANFEQKLPVVGRPGRYEHINVHIYFDGQ